MTLRNVTLLQKGSTQQPPLVALNDIGRAEVPPLQVEEMSEAPSIQAESGDVTAGSCGLARTRGREERGFVGSEVSIHGDIFDQVIANPRKARGGDDNYHKTPQQRRMMTGERRGAITAHGDRRLRRQRDCTRGATSEAPGDVQREGEAQAR